MSVPSIAGIESICQFYGASRVLTGEAIPPSCRTADLVAVFSDKVELHRVSPGDDIMIADALEEAAENALREFKLPIETVTYRSKRALELKFYNINSSPATITPAK